MSIGYLHGKRIQKAREKHPKCCMYHNLAMGHLSLKGIDFVSYFNPYWEIAPAGHRI